MPEKPKLRDQKMVSKNDVLVGVLVLVAGIYLWQIAPGGAFFANPGTAGVPAHNNTHYVGGVLAIVFGAVAFGLMKKTSKITWAVGALSIILGIVVLLNAAGNPLYAALQPHGQSMLYSGYLEVLVGLVGIGGAFMPMKMPMKK